MPANACGEQDKSCVSRTRAGFRKACTCVLACSAALAVIFAADGALASGYSIVHNFAGSPDGSAPGAAMIMDSTGNLYGTTFEGGTGTNCTRGCGTVFKISTKGKKTILYSFQGNTDGAGPSSRLIRDKAGNLYGTTEYGGDGIDCTNCGTVFKLAPDGTEAVLNQFVAGTDGAAPTGDLVMDGKGNLFGTTSAGGGSMNCTEGCGTVYEDVVGGDEKVLYAFTGGNDGSGPTSGLMQDAKGNFYGTTYSGGANNLGTVFKLSRVQGVWKEKVLHSFKGSDGSAPATGVIADTAGNLFGTTSMGAFLGTGCSQGCGTVFELTTGGTVKTLHAFKGPNKDGALAGGDLVRDGAGNLYAITLEGGAKNMGTVFKLAPGGTLTLLHSFGTITNDGGFPLSALVANPTGRLFGTTYAGGSSTNCSGGCGTVFSINE